MAKKNFTQMTTKKLTALLETASDEDRALIQAELDAREAVKAAPSVNETETSPVGGVGATDVVVGELTEEEEATIQAAAANGGKLPAAKRSDEEREALIAELKANVIGHKCRVLPMGKAQWANGVIKSILNDKRANNILLVIDLEDGRTVRKMHNAETLEVLEETVELARKPRAPKSTEPKEETPWDTMEEEITAASDKVGSLVSFTEHGTAAPLTGRIMTIVPDKRVKKLLYRIVVAGTADEPAKTLHKVVTAPLTVIEPIDEEGQKIHDAFVARREKLANREPKTLAERIAQAEIDLQKAEERVATAQAKVAAQKALIEKLKAEAEATVDAAEAPEAPAAEAADDLA